jgi:hypothetical protein
VGLEDIDEVADPGPRKLSYSHLRKAGFSHQVGVFGPEIF